MEKLLQHLVAETPLVMSPPESIAGHESSGVGGIGEDATVVPLWTTANEAATSTATHPTGLEWSCLFLMREVGSCCDSVPDFG